MEKIRKGKLIDACMAIVQLQSFNERTFEDDKETYLLYHARQLFDSIIVQEAHNDARYPGDMKYYVFDWVHSTLKECTEAENAAMQFLHLEGVVLWGDDDCEFIISKSHYGINMNVELITSKSYRGINQSD